MILESGMSFDPWAHLYFADVAINDPANPILLIDIYLSSTNRDLCPLEAILLYLAIQGDQQGFQFQFMDDWLLAKDQFVAKVKKLLHQSGVDSKKYAGHSFRIGAATTVSHCGISEATIKMLRR